MNLNLGMVVSPVSFVISVQAFTHISWDHDRQVNYERLEYLGDAILDHLLTYAAFKLNPLTPAV